MVFADARPTGGAPIAQGSMAESLCLKIHIKKSENDTTMKYIAYDAQRAAV